MRQKINFLDFVKITFRYTNLWAILIPMHLLGIYAIYDIINYWKPIFFLYIILGYFCIMILGVTIGYHRYFSHNSFQTYKPIKFILLFFGMLSGQGSPIFWITTHRYLHHLNSDKELDPHTPKKGIFTSWFLWLWKIEEKDIKGRYVFDLLKDPLLLFCHKNYLYIYFTSTVIIALIDFNFWIYFVIVPSLITFHSYSITNYTTHFSKLGYQNYNTNDNSTNVPFLWPFVLGECWHNNHHGDPKSYHFSLKKWEIDPAGFLIKFIKK